MLQVPYRKKQSSASSAVKGGEKKELVGTHCHNEERCHPPPMLLLNRSNTSTLQYSTVQVREGNTTRVQSDMSPPRDVEVGRLHNVFLVSVLPWHTQYRYPSHPYPGLRSQPHQYETIFKRRASVAELWLSRHCTALSACGNWMACSCQTSPRFGSERAQVEDVGVVCAFFPSSRKPPPTTYRPHCTPHDTMARPPLTGEQRRIRVRRRDHPPTLCLPCLMIH